MTTFHGKTILITGGAAGLGRLMAETCLREGARMLILWDLNHEAMASFQATWGVGRVHIETVDLSQLAEIERAYASTRSAVGPIEIVFNNAGIIVGKSFAAHTAREIDQTLAINTTALMHVARLCLPDMQKAPAAHIVNIASAAGLVSNPGMSVYCGSKWAVIGWSDSLRLEMSKTHPQVKVTTVTPYYIDTGMFEGVRSPLIPILKPEEAVRRIIRGVRNDKIFVRMPKIVHLLPLVRGLLSVRLFDWIVGQGLGVYESMAGFKGHGRPKP